MSRVLIAPPLRNKFNNIYAAIESQLNASTPQLQTTGGVEFIAEAKTTRDGRHFISLPHNNRIYEDDWGYTSNDMGNDGQRIGQYSVPIDHWASLL